jgi:hypothetical protein
VYSFLRLVMVLPFLPHEHIRDAFLDLDDKAPDSVAPVMDYVYITWIRNNMYPIRNSIFMCSIRTNNDVEGWHNNLNSRVSSRGPVPFYLRVTELFKEASGLPMTLRLVTEGKLHRYQRKKTGQTQGRLFNLWKRYCNREISASHLLSSCGAIYGPQAE